MRFSHYKPVLGPALILSATVLLGTVLFPSPRLHAFQPSSSDARIVAGYRIAPVKLHTQGLNPALVGIGSYIVNAQADCNGCHTSPDYGPEYSTDPTLVGNNPPGVVNAAAYLGGGSFFATFPGGANIFSRNLTPDVSGKPEGGHTLQEFLNIMRTGHDYDTAHPFCPATGAAGCISPATPINALVLQIMPWPTFSHMSDNDLTAIYEYLSAIPCISHQGPVALPDGTPPLPSNLFQTCPVVHPGADDH